jgi:hypothetical protein
MNILWLLTLTLAHASPFASMKGTYQIEKCQGTGATKKDDLCQFAEMTVYPQDLVTAIYFSIRDVNTSDTPLVRSFGFTDPQDTHQRYVDSIDEATYETRTSVGYEFTKLQRKSGELFHLQLVRKFPASKYYSAYRIDLRKMSDQAKPLPTRPPDPDEDEH